MDRLIRTSFGVPVFYDMNRKELFADCDDCNRKVKMNGPGSDATFLARCLKSLLWVVKPESQELFTPCADLHDLQCHKGLTDDELKAVNKEFRRNCLAIVNRKYNDLMRDLSRELAGQKKVRFWEIIFSTEKRDLWKKQRNLSELIQERKDREHDAELYYTALKLFSRSVVPQKKCTEKSRANESDCWQ